MKKIHILFLLIIAGLVIALVREKARHDELLMASEKTQLQALSTCRETVAELKFQCQASETGFEEPDPIQRITELQSMLQDRRLEARENTIDDLIDTLGLEKNVKQAVMMVLNEFDNERRDLIGRSRADNTYLTPSFNEELETLRTTARLEIEKEMTGGQWNELVGNGFLKRLGLNSPDTSEGRELQTTEPVID